MRNKNLSVSTGAHLTTRTKLNLKDTTSHLLNALLLCVPRGEGHNLSGVDVLQFAEGEESALARQDEGDLE